MGTSGRRDLGIIKHVHAQTHDLDGIGSNWPNLLVARSDSGGLCSHASEQDETCRVGFIMASACCSSRQEIEMTDNRRSP